MSLYFPGYAFCQETSITVPARILILLDGSGSMKQLLPDSTEKFKTATDMILRIMDSVYSMNSDVEFSLRVFGHQHFVSENNCVDTKNEVPFAKNNRAIMAARLKEIIPSGVSPIAFALEEAALHEITDEEHVAYSIIMITDGVESCGGNICSIMTGLIKKKIFFKPYVVGLETNVSMKKDFACMGEYLKVTTSKDKTNTTNTIINAIKPTLNIPKLAYLKILPEDIIGKIPDADKIAMARFLRASKNCKLFEMQNNANAARGRRDSLSIKNAKKDPNAVVLQNGDTYNGQYDRIGAKVNRAVYTWANGEKYYGEFKDDKRTGTGMYYWPNGDRFEGEWKDDEPVNGALWVVLHGKNHKPDTLYYEGKFSDGKMNGYGLAKTPVYKYAGEWKENKKWGHGKRIFTDGRSYDGEWQDDKMWGHGIYILSNKDRYEGEWKDEMKNGKADIVLANGNRYTGNYVDDKVNGDVVYIYANGDKYEGGYKNDLMNGQGVYTWANGDTYIGNWVDNFKNGHGVFTSKAGEIYDGNWVDDKQNGLGKCTWPSGNYYEGNWKDNLRDGQGTCTWKDGGKYTGTWKYGKMNGFGIYNKDGKKYEGNWKDDVFKGK